MRAIGADGIIRTVLGVGAGRRSSDTDETKAASFGDGGPKERAGFTTSIDTTAAFDHVVGIHGLAVAADHTLYVVDSLRIRKITPDGIVSTVAGTGTICPTNFCGDGGLATAAQLRGPVDVALSPDGRTLYMIDFFHLRVVDFGTGFITTLTNTEFYNPDALAVGRDGTLYVARSRTIYAMDPSDETVTTVTEVTDWDASDDIAALAVAADNTLYIANARDRSTGSDIVALSPDRTRQTRLFKGKFSRGTAVPRGGLALSPDGRTLYFTDRHDHAVAQGHVVWAMDLTQNPPTTSLAAGARTRSGNSGDGGVAPVPACMARAASPSAPTAGSTWPTPATPASASCAASP